MPAQIVLKALGLLKSPNQLSTPDGSLTQADNVVIRRENVIEPIRGRRLYGTLTATVIKQLLTYKERILRHFGSTLQFDTKVLNSNNESIFSSFSGSFNETQTGLRIKSVEASGNLYFTTSSGIKKISASTAEELSTASGFITNAGGIKSINGTAEVIYEYGNSTGFLPEDSTVAYRTVWGIIDANNNTILGTPSNRIVVYNPMLDLLIPDFNKLLGALDDITTNTTTAFIGDGDYIDTLKLEYNSSSTDLKNALISLAQKIDEDILVAGNASQPIVIYDGVAGTAAVASNVATITKASGGNFDDYFAVGDKIFLQGFDGSAAVLNGAQTVVAVTNTTITFNITTANFTQSPITGTGSQIVSYEYRNSIENISYQNTVFNLNTTTINNPATNNQLNILQNAILGIIDALNLEPTTIITSLNQTDYISLLDVTSTSNVQLSINIPDDVSTQYFLQIYRSDISQATGVTVLSDLSPNDEMQLVYQASPTQAEITAGEMVVIDQLDDAFAGANLYTNPDTGEGILQSNDVPPLAKDINRFKNVVFYANTKTRQRLNLNLLGVTNFKAGNITNVTAANPAVITTDVAHGLSTGDLVYINGTGTSAINSKVWKITVISPTTFSVPELGVAGTVGYWSNSMVAISNSTSTQQYYFIKEMSEVTNIATIADVADSLNGDYFLLNSGKDQNEYYVWYKTSGGATNDPAVSGKTGIRVNVATNATANDVAEATRNVLSRYPNEWVITGATNNIISTNVIAGVTTNASAATSGFTITITQEGRGENDAINEVGLSNAVSPAQAVDETSNSFINVVNKNSLETVYIYYLSGLADIPGKMLIEGRSLASSQFAILSNNSTVGESFDPPITPDLFITGNTVANPTVVTTSSNHNLGSTDTAVIAFSNSTPNINGQFTITNLTATTFSIPVNVTIAGTSGVVINLENAVISDNEEKVNRVYFSKLDQPEAVPLTNYFDVGSREKQILRIIPLRDSLFVFKQDGVYRISGESSPFNLALFDSTVKLLAADSIGILDNRIYGWMDAGIQTVDESGVSDPPISRPIDTDILKLASASYVNFPTVTWGVGYDSDNSYTVYTNSEQTDTVATIGYRYSSLTNTWTTISRSQNAGIINDSDDKLYTAAGDVNYIDQERKNFDRTDYADREFSTSLSDSSYFENGAKLKLLSVSDLQPGDVLVQEQYVTVNNFNALLAKLDLDVSISSVPITSISTGTTPTIINRNLPFTSADVNTGTETITITSHGFVNGNKVRFISSGTLPGGLSANIDYFIINTTVNTFQISATLGGSAINLTSGGTGTHTVFRFHNLVAGDYVSIIGSNSDPVIDGTYEVQTVINGYSYTINVSNAVTTAGTTGTTKFNYSQTQLLSGGDNIRNVLLSLAAKLDTDPGTQLTNYSTIIADIGPLNISSISANNPAVITTSTNHGLQTGRYVSINGTNSIPDVDGNHEIIVISPTTFSVPVSVQISGGAAGTVVTLSSNFNDLLGCFNILVTNLNIDPGVIFNNYQEISTSTPFESLITGVNGFTNELTLSPALTYLVGPVTAYRAIETVIEYSPSTMGDPLGWKHMTNFTMMFDNKAFTEARVGFASDLLPEFIDVTFSGDGNGIFGYGQFGSGFFGGGSNGEPFRTIFPRNVMRCRYFRIRFTHRIARECYSVYGITVDGSISQSTRAYRK